MEAKLKVFLDTSVQSATGGARLILKLGEAEAVSLWVGPWVLEEAKEVVGRKSPKSREEIQSKFDFRSGRVTNET